MEKELKGICVVIEVLELQQLVLVLIFLVCFDKYFFV